MNNKEKESFFALYINQHVLCDGVNRNVGLTKAWNWRHQHFYLSLKPLSAISYEDKMAVYAMGWTYNKKGLQIAPITEWKAFTPEQIDFLRSRGYLLPFRQYSCEQLLEMGWCKIDNN